MQARCHGVRIRNDTDGVCDPMSKPQVSVIIPSYNCMAYLPNAFASIAAQTTIDHEIIVTDDGSTDGTDEWLTSKAREDKRVVILKSNRIGPSKARNLALEQAKAPLIAFLDADDLWLPGKLAEQVDFHEQRPDVAFSFSDYLHVDPQGRSRGTCLEYWRPDYLPLLPSGYSEFELAEANILSCNLVGTSTVVARLRDLQIANGFATLMNSGEDWDLWLRMAKRAPVGFSSAVTMIYLMRPDSVTTRTRNRIGSMEMIVSRYDARTEPEFVAAIKAARHRIAFARADCAAAEGRHVEAALSHLRGFVQQPRLRSLKAAGANLVAGISFNTRN